MHLPSRFGLIAAISFVLLIWGGIAAEGQSIDSGSSGTNIIQQVPLPAGIGLAPGLEATNPSRRARAYSLKALYRQYIGSLSAMPQGGEKNDQ